jgi:hypothetical protein
MMAHRIEAILLLVLAMSCGPAAAEDLAAVSPFSFLVSPSFALPLGPGASDFELGAGGKLSMEYAIPALKNLSLRAGLLYGYQALQAQAGSISELGAVAGAAWAFPFTRALSSHVFAEAGYAFGVMNGDSLANGGGSGLAEAGAGLAYALNPTLALRFDLSYRYYFDLYGALTASLALSVTPPAAAKPASLPLPFPSAPVPSSPPRWSVQAAGCTRSQY